VSNRFASGKFAIAQCDRCNFRYKLKDLKTEIVKTKPYKIRVCPAVLGSGSTTVAVRYVPCRRPASVARPKA
jgi:hypothetical protein